MPLIVTPGELARRAELYHQLGASISAGIPLLKALEMLAANPVAYRDSAALRQMLRHLRGGASLTDSLTAIHGWLPDFDKALLAAGETSGRIDTSFQVLSVYYQTRAQVIRQALADFLTTGLTLHVFIILFPLRLLVPFVLGLLDGNYAAMIPWLIHKGIVFGVLYGAVFAIAWACQGTRGERWRAFVEGFIATIPILGTAARYLSIARLSAALEALIRSGVPIINAWSIATAASGSPYLRRIAQEWKVQLDEGTTPAELVNRTRFFPEMFSHLYFSGEESGQLDDALDRLHHYYREEGFRKLRFFTKVLNGIIYGLLVLMVARTVFNFYLGHFGSILNN